LTFSTISLVTALAKVNGSFIHDYFLLGEEEVKEVYFE
jgi:hypothetical protein